MHQSIRLNIKKIFSSEKNNLTQNGFRDITALVKDLTELKKISLSAYGSFINPSLNYLYNFLFQ